jgi:hypothetical protein
MGGTGETFFPYQSDWAGESGMFLWGFLPEQGMLKDPEKH